MQFCHNSSTLPFSQPCHSQIEFSCPGKILHTFCGKFRILHGITQLHKASINCARTRFLARIKIIRVKAGIKCFIFHTVIDNILERNPTGVYFNLKIILIPVRAGQRSSQHFSFMYFLRYHFKSFFPANIVQSCVCQVVVHIHSHIHDPILQSDKIL